MDQGRSETRIGLGWAGPSRLRHCPFTDERISRLRLHRSSRLSLAIGPVPGGLGRLLHGVLVLGVMAARSHTLTRSARSRVKRTLLRARAGFIDPLLAQATVGFGRIPLDTWPRHWLIPCGASFMERMASGHPSQGLYLSADPPWGLCRGTRPSLPGDNWHVGALVIVVSIEKALPAQRLFWLAVPKVPYRAPDEAPRRGFGQPDRKH